MEDPKRPDNPGNENKTAIMANTTGDAWTGDFVAGTVLAGRYRIVGLIGKGGMGEVYKAEDLELEQTVALKFLPEKLSKNEDLLRRFRGEVRNARQVSHRNVCRVFDIGESDGRYYITMEYIDGDDLSMLLKRIGRLPADKAIDIARDICMGLSAIHKAGILHRDLKPANIIIDSNGEARITDFGIAGVEANVQGSEARAGTPAYMSPEQIAGLEVTQRSDIYSLGLVLFEIFTGRQVFEGDSFRELRDKHATSVPQNPSELVSGIDPLVDKVIAGCLEKIPDHRPESALKVAMSLPGGDPLRVALEAGQTPSPEMIAASPKKGALRPVVALMLVAAVLFNFGLLLTISKNWATFRQIPLERSPEALRERGREIIERFGYQPGDTISSFTSDNGYIDYLKENDPSADRWKKLASGQPPFMLFWYRSSPGSLIPLSREAPTFSDPPNNQPGMARLMVDTKGRLTRFQGVPSRFDEAPANTGEFDWAAVFKEAGLDIASFKAVEPHWTPLQAFDQRRAFLGTYPGGPPLEIRVEMSAYRGKLVDFDVIEPWVKPNAASGFSGGPRWFAFILSSLYFGILFGSVWLAIRNVRRGSGDMKGAIRVALTLFVLRMVIWIFSTYHVASFAETNLLIAGLSGALFWGIVAGSIYLALEPYLRKFAPERVISWNRLLAGSWSDPLIGRDVLIAAALGSISLGLTALVDYFIPVWNGRPPNLRVVNIRALAGIGEFPEMLLDNLSFSLIAAFMFSFLILFLGLLVRRQWLGAVILWIFFMITATTDLRPETASNLIFWTIPLFVAVRFGVLALMANIFFGTILIAITPGDLSAWYAGNLVLFSITFLGLTAWGFYTSTAGQKLWQGKLLDGGD